MSIATVRTPVQSRRLVREAKLRHAAVRAISNYHAAILLDEDAAERVTAERTRGAIEGHNATQTVLRRCLEELVRSILAFSPNYAEKDTVRTRHENRAVRLGKAAYVVRYAEDDFDLEMGQTAPPHSSNCMRLRVVPVRSKRDLDRIDAVVVDLKPEA